MRLMVELAIYQNDSPVLLKDIARRQQISASYLEQLVLNLKAAGLVKSIRGARGGFILGRPPENITLLEIFKASEGSLFLAECLENSSLCKLSQDCATRELWQELKDVLSSTLSRHTLAALAEKQRKKMQGSETMYHI